VGIAVTAQVDSPAIPVIVVTPAHLALADTLDIQDIVVTVGIVDHKEIQVQVVLADTQVTQGIVGTQGRKVIQVIQVLQALVAIQVIQVTVDIVDIVVHRVIPEQLELLDLVVTVGIQDIVDLREM